ncbi:hypothetical protein V1508DRAFT_67247 [Lipomyces doorenjongii]|uniref:uncharacterized protein n=1 Tax=Lipomyces doorenjongii TaxID=383834 RepID=UPI0034CF33B1
MADSECEILSDSGVDDLSVGSFKRPQRARRLDYRLINDGSDDEAAPEDRMVKRGRFPSPLDSSEPITPDDSASQLSQGVDHVKNCPQNEAGSLDGQSEISLDSMESSKPSAQRQNTLLWSYYNVSPFLESCGTQSVVKRDLYWTTRFSAGCVAGKLRIPLEHRQQQI